MVDLGAAWKEWTGLPFVFAVWAARRQADQRRRARSASPRCSSRGPGGCSTSTSWPPRPRPAPGIARAGLPRLPRRSRLRAFVPAPRGPDRLLPPAGAGRRSCPTARSALHHAPPRRHDHASIASSARVPVDTSSSTSSAPLLELGRLADAERWRLHPEPVVTYIIDRNINYTNVCVADCEFCAFYRRPEGRRRLRPDLRADRREDRRVQGARRRADPAAGRAQPVHPVRVVPRADALHQAQPSDPHPRLLAVGGGVLQRAVPACRCRR